MKNPEREPEPTEKIEIFFSFPRDIHTILALKNGELANSEVVDLFIREELKPEMMVDWRGKKRPIKGWRLHDNNPEEETPLKARLYVGKDVYAVERVNKTYPTLAQEPRRRPRFIFRKGQTFFKEQWYSHGKIREGELFELIIERQILTSRGIKVIGKER